GRDAPQGRALARRVGRRGPDLRRDGQCAERGGLCAAAAELRLRLERCEAMDTRYAAEPPLGAMVRARESAAGDPGLVSSGRGDAGGRSYGLYQFKSRRDEGAG